MKNIYKKKWFSILIAIWLVTLISLLAFLILEYIVSFSKNFKWIENSSNAYYLANSWIEDGLFFINRNIVWSEYNLSFPSSPKWTSIDITASWTLLPPAWQWNSEFDNNWNKISANFPVQLEIWNNMVVDWSNVAFRFRVPDLDGNNENDEQNDEELDGSGAIVNWQLSSGSGTLNSTSWSWIEASDVDWIAINFSSKKGTLLDGSGSLENFISEFYRDTSHGCDSYCSLKLSIVNKLNSTIGGKSVQVPYLEWKIDFWNNNVPLRYAIINARGKSYWFTKNLKVRIPQQTVIEAFDFTIIQ